MTGDEKDWKLKLRYGLLKTPFKHYTLIADGIVHGLMDGFECRPGKAFMSMKVWAESEDEAFDMIQVIGEQVGFEVSGRIQLYDTEPEELPREKPYGYSIKFSPYES